MADQKIELEIVLDDGSIKKAFGTIRKEAETTGKELDDFLKFDPMAALGLNAYIDLFDRLTGYIKRAGQAMVNLALEAEQVRVVNAQFAAITQQTGIATEAFNQAIMRSIDGLIDDEEALNIANQAMIRLGVTAQRLPQLFELARKAAAAGFGDMKSNVEAFVFAIQTGNERALKQHLGLVVDLSVEQKKLAKELGLNVQGLNDQQRAFANANTIIDQAQKKFGNIEGNIRSFSDSMARLRVESGNAFERLAVGFDRIFGPALKAGIDSITASLSEHPAKYKANQVAVKDLGDEIRKVEEKLAMFQARLERPGKMENAFAAKQIVEYSAYLQQLIIRQNDANLMQSEQTKRIEAYSAAQIKASESLKKTEEQKRLEMQLSEQRAFQYNQAMLGFMQQENASRQANLQFISDQGERQAQMEILYQDQLSQIVEKGINDRRQIEQNFSNEKGFSQAERDALQLAQVEAQNQALLNAQQNYQMNSQGAWGKYVQNAKNTLGDLGNYTKTTLVQGIGQSLAAMGSAIAKGEDAWVAFRNSFLGILGDIAINMGNMFIAMGIANQAIPIFGNITGGAAIAAGAALVVLGGILKAFGGGAGGAKAMAGGGGVGAEPATTPEAPAFDATAPIGDGRMAPQTVVNFQVMGDILDSSDTQSRIVALLNDAIDTKGAVIRGV
jgi:hypothetical protein